MERILFFFRKEFHRDFHDKLELYHFIGLPGKNVSVRKINEALKTARLSCRPDELAKLEAGPTNGEEGRSAYTSNSDELSEPATNEAKESTSEKLTKPLNSMPDNDARHKAAEAEELAGKLQIIEDVLCDPRRRCLYDEVGWVGYCRLTDREINVTQYQEISLFGMVSRHRYAFMLPFVLATWAFLAQTILFSMKCDGSLGKSVSWMLVWTPMWFVDLLLLIIVAISFSEFVNIEGESIELKNTPVFVKIFNAVHLASIVLFQVLLFLQLDKVIDWNWFLVFSPWLFYEMVLFVKYIYANFVPRYESTNYFETESLRKCINHFLRAWLAVFVALKLNHQNDWNWGFVLLPVWMYLGMNVLWSCVYTCFPGFYSVTSGALLLSVTASCIWIPAWLVHRLEGYQITTFVIILQLLIAAICICCQGLCLCCFVTFTSRVGPDEDGDYKSEAGDESAVLPGIERTASGLSENGPDVVTVVQDFDIESNMPDRPNSLIVDDIPLTSI